jgi:hypothetical protein
MTGIGLRRIFIVCSGGYSLRNIIEMRQNDTSIRRFSAYERRRRFIGIFETSSAVTISESLSKKRSHGNLISSSGA